MGCQDDIPREVRWLARAEGWSELRCAGHIDREDVVEVPRHVAATGWWRMRIPGPLAALGRVRRRFAGHPL